MHVAVLTCMLSAMTRELDPSEKPTMPPGPADRMAEEVLRRDMACVRASRERYQRAMASGEWLLALKEVAA